MKLFFNRKFFTGRVHSKHTSSFIKYSEYDVTPAFYSLENRVRVSKLVGPFRARVHVTDLREKTYTLNVEVYDVTMSRLLARERSHAVIVDLHTRRSVTFDLQSPFYVFARRHLREKGESNTFAWSADAFESEVRRCGWQPEQRLCVTVQRSGIDCNGHLNDSIYFKYASQLLQQHSDQLHLRTALSIQPRKCCILFRREAVSGNDLCFSATSSGDAFVVDVKHEDVALATIKFELPTALRVQSLL